VAAECDHLHGGNNGIFRETETMRSLVTMIIRAIVPVFLVALLFFVLILQLVDLFANLWRYVENDVSFGQIGLVALYYLPKCITFSLPIASLFAVAFTLGTYQANNELIALFGSGISLARFTMPLLILGALLSLGSFFFEDRVVIDTYRQKNELSRQLLRENRSLSRSRPTVLDHNNTVIYHAEYYNNNNQTLSDLTIVERTPEGQMLRRIDADWAEWVESSWTLHDVRIFNWIQETGEVLQENRTTYRNEKLNAPTDNFRKSDKEVEEMPLAEAKQWIDSLIRSGLPYREMLTNYYRRFSFALTPFIVVLISAALGGRFKKNILLMSLLTSLSVSVLYYVFQMITVIMANHGYITPLAGAWTPFLFFTFLGGVLFKFSRS
jgi:lipopolysaccharide export system permease protein